MIVTTQAIVLSKLKYGEADLITTCLTESDGVKTYLLRGILKSKKGKLRSSYFQPLTQLELIAQHKNKGSLEYIREAKVLYPYKTLHTDIIKSTLVMFLSEVLKNSIQEEMPNPTLFQYLKYALVWLDEHNKIANFHNLFLLKLSQYLGFSPDPSNIEAPFFNLEEGSFQEQDSLQPCYSGERVEAFKKLFQLSFDDLHTISIPKKTRTDMLIMLLEYYQLHLQGFKQPKSLEVLQQLFE
ncbi:DNA repair protein RecO [Luteirhabdus pelagi]|uniref:DNA repair protein RecO n=1 Tax=Luteirhabdus pelagi TaxID=2792783 RepID=UPI0019398A86|nr:DNA repair protein RecO [Luteirhabdus pelagi]